MTDHRKQNSREARELHLPKVGTNKARIYAAIRQYGKPIHAKHIAQRIDLDYYEIQRRVSELVKAELIKPDGKADGLTLYIAI